MRTWTKVSRKNIPAIHRNLSGLDPVEALGCVHVHRFLYTRETVGRAQYIIYNTGILIAMENIFRQSCDYR